MTDHWTTALRWGVLAAVLWGPSGHAWADAQRDALIQSYLGEYSLISECDLLYHGIGRPRDLEKLQGCFGEDPVMEILAYANGHGVKRDLTRARRLAHELEHPMKDDLLRDLDDLETIPQDRELEPCSYAFSTVELVHCSRLLELREQVRIYDLGTPYRDHPDLRIRRYWADLEVALDAFLSAESEYVYDSLEGGSMQRYLPGATRAGILGQHREVLQRTVSCLRDESMTPDVYRDSDRHLNEVYNEVLHQADDPALRKALIQAQRRWIRYRDAMVEFCQAVADPRHFPDDVARSVVILLTQRRAETLWSPE